mmetsp:Transcript_4011/g.5893  ORF Transcript_4011/g.5893 Transcript_4011/m.5893 type:complete len:560 (+) Transcript_4011:271-1950(+)
MLLMSNPVNNMSQPGNNGEDTNGPSNDNRLSVGLNFNSAALLNANPQLQALMASAAGAPTAMGDVALGLVQQQQQQQQQQPQQQQPQQPAIPQQVLSTNRQTYRDFSRVAVEETPSTTKQDDSMTSPASAKEPPFPVKLHRILSNNEFQEYITWLPHGRSWRVLKPKAFEEKVIPLYFRHAKYASFMRQVNGWGFKRMTQGPDHNSYYHEMFLRGLPNLCIKMQRPSRSKQPTVDATESHPDFYRLSMFAPLPGQGGRASSSGGDDAGDNTAEASATTTGTHNSQEASIQSLDNPDVGAINNGNHNKDLDVDTATNHGGAAASMLQQQLLQDQLLEILQQQQGGAGGSTAGAQQKTSQPDQDWTKQMNGGNFNGIVGGNTAADSLGQAAVDGGAFPLQDSVAAQLGMGRPGGVPAMSGLGNSLQGLPLGQDAGFIGQMQQDQQQQVQQMAQLQQQINLLSQSSNGAGGFGTSGIQNGSAANAAAGLGPTAANLGFLASLQNPASIGLHQNQPFQNQALQNQALLAQMQALQHSATMPGQQEQLSQVKQEDDDDAPNAAV